jgi:hypothetical protein
MQPIRVTYAPTEICADSFYLARTRVTDAFADFECEGRRTGVFSSLEFNRMQEESAFDAILHLEDCLARTKKAYGVDSPLPGDMIALLVREMGAEGVLVGEDFPPSSCGRWRLAAFAWTSPRGCCLPNAA